MPPDYRHTDKHPRLVVRGLDDMRYQAHYLTASPSYAVDNNILRKS